MPATDRPTQIEHGVRPRLRHALRTILLAGFGALLAVGAVFLPASRANASAPTSTPTITAGAVGGR